MYNYGKIFTHREEFIGDVTRKWVALEGLVEAEAEAANVTRSLYEELLTSRLGGST
jgi:hypothetical protein